MVSCPCSNCWSISEDTKRDDRNGDEKGSFGIGATKDFVDAAVDESVESPDSVFFISSTCDFKNDTERCESSRKTKKSWWLSKSVNIAEEGIDGTLHHPSFLLNDEASDDFCGKNPINTQFWSTKKQKSVEMDAITHRSSRLRPVDSSKFPYSQKKRGSTVTRQQTILSDWGDVYEGLDSMHFSARGSLIFQRGVSSTFFDDVTARESRLPILPSKQKKITLRPGKVMGMYLGKEDYRFHILKLTSSLDEVVNIFLSVESGPTLPLSFDKTKKNRPKIMSKSLMRMTIEQNLGPHFDPKTKGLMFSLGSVNSKLCYKMSVCDLSNIENIFSVFCRDDNFTEE